MTGSTPDYRNTDLSFEQRAADLVSRMTLEEKVAQMLHTSPAIERLGIAEYNWWSEGLHGVARAGRATVFPQAIGMAASFDVDLLGRVAEIIRIEARAKHHQAVAQSNFGECFGLTYWSPNINIFRDPRWGRGHETYGEDPHLTARLGMAFCKGLQGDDPKHLGLVATPKHYAVHSGPESERHTFNAVVSGRDLRETYLPAFEACVREARVASIMGAYNRVYGEPCCGSKLLLQEILRDEWGFDGFVVSDCGAICDFHEHHKLTKRPAESAAMAVRNGCELNCGNTYRHLLSAVQAGLITEEEIDVALGRLMVGRMRLGMFDPPEEVSHAQVDPALVHCDEHREVSLQMARESIVLLKNEGDLLPLRDDLAHVAVIGPTGFSPDVLLGNYYGYSDRMSTILEGVVGAVSLGTRVTQLPGCTLAGKEAIPRTVAWQLQRVDLIIAVMGFAPCLEGEEGDDSEVAQSEGGGDRVSIGLPGRQLELLKQLHVMGKPVVLVLTGGSPIELNWAAENIPAIVMAWYPGERGGEAVADVLFGRYNPAGRLPLTFIKGLEQIPPFDDYTMAGRTYRFMTEEPLYRFGYGLSYTKFAYSNLSLSGEPISAGQTIEVSVDVANVGQRDGEEVVQMYVSDVEATVSVPIRQLRGFARIALAAGESGTVRFTLAADDLVVYDEDGTARIEPGAFRVSVGGGQPCDPASGAVTADLQLV